MNQNINILGANISNASYDDILNIIKEKIKEKGKFSFHNVNASIILKSRNSTEFGENLKSFSLLFGDGIGVYAASKILYGKNGLKQRVTGTDLYYHIFKYADECKQKCFFFGGSVEAVKLLPEAINKKYPGIQITGALPRETEFKKETLDIIQKSNSDILFVGLGTPYQEEWIAKNFNSVNIPVQIAVGSGIEFISGSKKRAPSFFRNLGLEWLYRIYLEPKRLWKRYFFGIPIFMFKIIIFKVKLLFK